MRKVLLRFVFDNFWQWQSVGNELHVGVAWLIVLLCTMVGVVFAVHYRSSKHFGESASVAFWLIIPAVLFAIRRFPGNIAFVRSGIPVFGYGLMMFVGFSSAAWLASRRVRAIGQPPEVIWDMTMWALIPGLGGARATYLAQNWERVFAGKQGWDFLLAFVALWDGGIVFLGGVVGGIIGIVIFCRRRGITPIAMFDVIAPSLFVGEGFGRIGCFLYGCCFGRACDLPWAVQFPPDSLTFEKLVERGTISGDSLMTIRLHPTQLYSSFAAFVLAAILAWFFRRRPFDGAVVSVASILYGITRFGLETLRDDEPERWGTGLTFSQLMGIGLVITGICGIVWSAQRRTLTGSSPPRSKQ